jgi:hypothetical protein
MSSDTRERSLDFVRPMGKLRNLDNLISDIPNSSVRTREFVNPPWEGEV